MRLLDQFFTSESVTEGHPDKIADQISDAVLDAMLSQDPYSRVACETLITTGMVVLAGEVTTRAVVDLSDVVRSTIRAIGYDDSAKGFDWKTCAVLTSLDKQSPDIALGVDESAEREQGAGDQGLMFGFACDETPELMPLPISLSHRLMRRLAQVRREGIVPFFRPDGKGQVTIRYENGRPAAVDAVVVSTQHGEEVELAQVKEAVFEEVIRPVLDPGLLTADTHYHINPTGRFVVGGPQGDAGLTGRKIIVDTYGGMGRHGGGAFSGKDPTKVDRSAAYMARYIAKNIVAAGLARRCEVQLAYAIGVAEPVSIRVDTFDTGQVDDVRIAQLVREEFGTKPREIIDTLQLRRPIYRTTAAYGHFGRVDGEFTWERTDRAAQLRDRAGLRGEVPTLPRLVEA